MLFSIYINQKAAVDWGLNLNQAAVFSVIYAAAAWADKSGGYWNISKGKIIQELPLLTDKPDTVYRLQKQLIDKGLVEKKVVESKDFFRLTRKGMAWAFDNNSVGDGLEARPQESVGVIVDEVGRKNIRGSEINPSEGVFFGDDRKNIRDSSENYPAELGKISDVLNNQDNITNINYKTSCATSGEVLSESWSPPKDIYLLCKQMVVFTDDEFRYLVMDYKSFWLSGDGMSRSAKPRSWTSHFKNSFSGRLNKLRSDRGLLVRKTRDISVEEQLSDVSWAN